MTAKRLRRKKYISVYPRISNPQYDGKPIVISVHAIKRSRQRGIAFPDQVYNALTTGEVQRFGRRGIRFVKRTRRGSIVCVGEDIGDSIFIKTIERGN